MKLEGEKPADENKETTTEQPEAATPYGLWYKHYLNIFISKCCY